MMASIFFMAARNLLATQRVRNGTGQTQRLLILIPAPHPRRSPPPIPFESRSAVSDPHVEPGQEAGGEQRHSQAHHPRALDAGNERKNEEDGGGDDEEDG